MTTETTVRLAERAPALLGQTVIVIGGSAGIGLETARLARAEGADVIITGRNPDRLRKAADEVGAASTAAFVFASNVPVTGRATTSPSPPMNHTSPSSPSRRTSADDAMRPASSMSPACVLRSWMPASAEHTAPSWLSLWPSPSRSSPMPRSSAAVVGRWICVTAKRVGVAANGGLVPQATSAATRTRRMTDTVRRAGPQRHETGRQGAAYHGGWNDRSTGPIVRM